MRPRRAGFSGLPAVEHDAYHMPPICGLYGWSKIDSKTKAPSPFGTALGGAQTLDLLMPVYHVEENESPTTRRPVT